MGFAVGRDTGIFHAGVCDSCDDGDSGVGDDSSAGQGFRKQHDSVYVDGDFAVSAAVIASADIGRECGVEIFLDAAGVFTSGNLNHHVYIPPKNQKQIIEL